MMMVTGTIARGSTEEYTKTTIRTHGLESTGIEVKIGTGEDTKTVTKIAHPSNRDDRKTTTIATGEVDTTGRRKKMNGLVSDLEEDRGTPDHGLDHGQGHLVARKTRHATVHARLDDRHTAPLSHERAGDSQILQHRTRTLSKPSLALSHLRPHPLCARAVGVRSKPIPWVWNLASLATTIPPWTFDRAQMGRVTGTRR